MMSQSRGRLLLKLALNKSAEKSTKNVDDVEPNSRIPSPCAEYTELQLVSRRTLQDFSNNTWSEYASSLPEDPMFTPSGQNLLLESTDFIENNLMDMSTGNSDKENSFPHTSSKIFYSAANLMENINDEENLFQRGLVSSTEIPYVESKILYTEKKNSVDTITTVDETFDIRVVTNAEDRNSYIAAPTKEDQASNRNGQSLVDEFSEAVESLITDLSSDNSRREISLTSSPEKSSTNILSDPVERVKIKKVRRNPEQCRQYQKNKHPILPPCKNTCIKKCTTKITEQDREAIWTSYWKLNTQRRRDYISRQVSKTKVAVKYTACSKRINTLLWKLGDSQVCKPMFLHTIGYTNDRVVQAVLQSYFKNGICSTTASISAFPDLRGKHVPPHANPIEYVKLIDDFIESFKPNASHYNLKHAPNRRYLPIGCSFTSIYDLLGKKLAEEGHKKCSWGSFYKIMKKKNLSNSCPIQDICTKCKEHETTHPNTLSDKQVEGADEPGPEHHNCDDCDMCEACEEYPGHIFNRNVSRSYLEDDQKVAVGSSGKTAVYTVDMQKVITLPKLSTKDLFFSRKLVMYNETFAQPGKNKTAVCLLWHECESGRKAYNIATSYVIFIKKYCRDLDNLILYMDNCNSQNKNKTLYSALLRLINDYDVYLKTIKIEYLEPGHTFMAADSVHACIARKLNKDGDLYDYDDYVSTIRKSRRNLEVYSFGHNEVILFKDEMKRVFPKGYNIKNYKIVEFRRGHVEIFVKIKYDQADFTEIDVFNQAIKSEINNSCGKVQTIVNIPRQQENSSETFKIDASFKTNIL